MADNVDIISGIIYGVYQSAFGRMNKIQARENIIKYLTRSSDLELISELAKQKNRWVSCKYILHMLLWGLRDDCHKAVILQYMSDEQIAVLKDAISVVKEYNQPDGTKARMLSNNYKKKTQILSKDEKVRSFSAQIAIKIAENWDDVVTELNVWVQMIDEFKRNPAKGRKRREYMKDKTGNRLHQQENYKEHRPERLAQKQKYDADCREEINARRRRRYQENPEPAKERSRIYQITHAEAVSEKNSRYYQEHKAEKAEKAKQRLARLNQQCKSAKKVCAAYVFLVNLKEKDPKKYLELYTRKQNPLTHMLKTCVALQNMDINMCPFYNSECGYMFEECCNKKVLAIPNVIDELSVIANNLKRR